MDCLLETCKKKMVMERAGLLVCYATGNLFPKDESVKC